MAVYYHDASKQTEPCCGNCFYYQDGHCMIDSIERDPKHRCEERFEPQD